MAPPEKRWGTMEVIVTDGHTRMALAAVRELGEAGHRVTVLCQEGKSPIGHASRYAAVKRFLPGDARQWASWFSANIAGNPVLLPVGAAMTALCASGALEGVCQTAVPSLEALENANDKRHTAAVAQSLGIKTPRRLDPAAAPAQYPVVLKYWFGEGLGLPAAERYCIARDEREFRAAHSRMDALQSPILVEEYAQGDGFGVSAVLNRDSRPAALFCHRRIRSYPVSGGPATLAESVWPAKMVQAALALFSGLKLRGFAMAEFRGTEDDFGFLEINPRVWGTFPFGRLCGVPLAERYARLACGEALPEAADCRYPLGRRMQYLAGDVLGAGSLLKKGKLSAPAAVLSSLLSPRSRGGVFDSGDLEGSMAYVRSLARRMSS